MFGILKLVGGGIFKMFGGDIAKDILGGIGDHFKAKRDLKAARANNELEIEKIRAQSISKQDTADIDLNYKRVEQAESTWKDEFWTIIFGAMFVSAFFAPDKLQAGLVVLGAMDADMKVTMQVVIGSAFGVSLWRKLRK